jgi:hypothetical protein
MNITKSVQTGLVGNKKMRSLNNTPFLVKQVENALIVSVINNGFNYVATKDRNMWRLEKFWPDGKKIPTIETFESIEKLANASSPFCVLPLLLKLGCYENRLSRFATRRT